MYRLTIFILISSAIPQQLVGAIHLGELPSKMKNLYVDSYEHESSEDYESLVDEDTIREAILLHPEEVIDIPPVSLEREYEISDFRDDKSRNDYVENLRGAQITRSVLGYWVDQILQALGIFPSEVTDVQPPAPDVFYYYLDDSLDQTQKTNLKALMLTIAEKTCMVALDDQGKADVIFKGVPGCIHEMDGKTIIIGRDCYFPGVVAKIAFKVLKFCGNIDQVQNMTSSSAYRSEFRNELRLSDEDLRKCVDKIPNCDLLSANDGCTLFAPFLPAFCPRTCRVCGDECVDHSTLCEAKDTVRNCLTFWSQMRYTCADTCGVCNINYKKKCIDYFNECRWLAKKGYCPKFPDLMKEYCPVSCGYCTPTACIDERKDCAEMKREGACEKMPRLMYENCRKTCNLCQSPSRNSEYELKKTEEECSPDMGYVVEHCAWTRYVPQ